MCVHIPTKEFKQQHSPNSSNLSFTEPSGVSAHQSPTSKLNLGGCLERNKHFRTHIPTHGTVWGRLDLTSELRGLLANLGIAQYDYILDDSPARVEIPVI